MHSAGMERVKQLSLPEYCSSLSCIVSYAISFMYMPWANYLWHRL